MKTNKDKIMLPTFMAKACSYAQEHVDDSEAWPNDLLAREKYFTCVSFQMSCFFAQNTVYGKEGVESDIVISELVELPMKSEKIWQKIINKIAKELGGWK
jgi:hypothetical protein